MSRTVSDTSLVDEDGEVAELTDDWFGGATLHEGGLVKRRPGERGPGKRPAKRSVTLRLDPDVIEKFRALGPGWQARINEALKATKV